ncbi:MAG: ABC transporter ATP-binding protein/permease [Lachnospiraceae bacterium]|nr:ABC transporter ATP-binding protein/permease [Lachnospiraceae bacterium]
MGERKEYKLGSVSMKTDWGGMRGRAAEKPHDFRRTVMSLISYARKERGLFFLVIFFSAGSALFTLFGPGKLSVITDIVTEGIRTGDFDLQSVKTSAAYLVIVYIIAFLLQYAQRLAGVKLAESICFRMRRDTAGKLEKIPLSRFDSASFGDLLSRTTNDIDMINDSIRLPFGDIINSFTLFAGAAVFMIAANLPLALISIVLSLAGFAAMRLIIVKSQRYFVGSSYWLGAVNGHIEEAYAAHQLVKTYNGEAEEAAEFDIRNGQLYENKWKSHFMSGISNPLMDFIGNFSYLAVCAVGAAFAIQGKISFGTIVAFIVYIKLFTTPFGQIAQGFTSLQSAAAAAERVFDILSEKEMEDESGKPAAVPGPGRVTFENVSFGYTPEVPVIRDISVDIAPGTQVAIVGPTGAGKTTLVNLLMRFYDPDEGRILIDGTDTRDLRRESVRDLFGMVLQEAWMLEDTIENNILFAAENVSHEQVIEACRAVGIDSLIASLPQGYDTVLRNDSSLSAGQKQLIAIGRAMLLDRPLLIMDEATSSVDTRTEQVVQDAIDRLRAGRTSFTIAHRLSTIRKADLILVIDNGEIAEQGTHEELIAAGGEYAKMWNSQFAEE